MGLEYNGSVYYYEKNIQNDVVGILNSNYEEVVKYKYDSYGKLLRVEDSNGNEIVDINNIGIINPFRYRSYYYDNEIELYYLNSRYYNLVVAYLSRKKIIILKNFIRLVLIIMQHLLYKNLILQKNTILILSMHLFMNREINK